MDAVDYILDGLAAALELERELGVRSVEIDRAVLAPAAPGAGRETGDVRREAAPVAVGRETGDVRREAAPAAVGRETGDVRREVAPAGARRETGDERRGTGDERRETVRNAGELVFLHDGALSAKGVEMMAKILTALGRPQAPIVVGPSLPWARVTVVLGGRALRKFFPTMKGGPGLWQRLPDGRDVLITYSPEYILRFGEVTPAVEKIKHDMWNSLKAVRQRLSPT